MGFYVQDKYLRQYRTDNKDEDDAEVARRVAAARRIANPEFLTGQPHQTTQTVDKAHKAQGEGPAAGGS